MPRRHGRLAADAVDTGFGTALRCTATFRSHLIAGPAEPFAAKHELRSVEHQAGDIVFAGGSTDAADAGVSWLAFTVVAAEGSWTGVQLTQACLTVVLAAAVTVLIAANVAVGVLADATRTTVIIRGAATRGGIVGDAKAVLTTRPGFAFVVGFTRDEALTVDALSAWFAL